MNINLNYIDDKIMLLTKIKLMKEIY